MFCHLLSPSNQHSDRCNIARMSVPFAILFQDGSASRVPKRRRSSVAAWRWKAERFAHRSLAASSRRADRTDGLRAEKAIAQHRIGEVGKDAGNRPSSRLGAHGVRLEGQQGCRDNHL